MKLMAYSPNLTLEDSKGRLVEVCWNLLFSSDGTVCYVCMHTHTHTHTHTDTHAHTLKAGRNISVDLD